MLTLDEKSRAVRTKGAQDALSCQKVQDFLPMAVVFSALRPDSTGLFAHRPNSTGPGRSLRPKGTGLFASGGDIFCAQVGLHRTFRAQAEQYDTFCTQAKSHVLFVLTGQKGVYCLT